MKIRGKIQTATAALSGFNWLTFLLVSATIVLGVLYIWQVNVAATRGFTMRDLDREIEELRLENDRLNMDVAHLRSADSVTTRMKMLGLRPVQTIEYVTPGGGSVAINR